MVRRARCWKARGGVACFSGREGVVDIIRVAIVDVMVMTVVWQED